MPEQPPPLAQPIVANNIELIMYQLGELKALLSTMNSKFDTYKADTDKRLNDLEKFQAAQIVQDAQAPKLDVQKIILAAFSLISSIVATALWFQRSSGK